MLRWIGRKLMFCIVLLCLFHYLNVTHPGWMETLGRWVGGEIGNKISVTVSDMLEDLGEGNPLREAVEVFREAS